MINVRWKEKLKASGIHAICTVVVGCLTAALVFLVWFPGELANMLSGAKIFGLVLLGEVVLGPVLSFVIYDSRKRRRELIRDYLIIISVQFCALGYGLFKVYQARPVYYVFVKDRIEVVSLLEYEKRDLDDAGKSIEDIPMWGPELVCTERPSDPSERTELLFSGLEGRDIQHIPKYYRPCEESEISTAMYGIEELKMLRGYEQITQITHIDLNGNLGWLPVVTRFGAWVGLYPESNVNSPFFVDVNPFEYDLNVEIDENSVKAPTKGDAD